MQCCAEVRSRPRGAPLLHPPCVRVCPLLPTASRTAACSSLAWLRTSTHPPTHPPSRGRLEGGSTEATLPQIEVTKSTISHPYCLEDAYLSGGSTLLFTRKVRAALLLPLLLQPFRSFIQRAMRCRAVSHDQWQGRWPRAHALHPSHLHPPHMLAFAPCSGCPPSFAGAHARRHARLHLGDAGHAGWWAPWWQLVMASRGAPAVQGVQSTGLILPPARAWCQSLGRTGAHPHPTAEGRAAASSTAHLHPLCRAPGAGALQPT